MRARRERRDEIGLVGRVGIMLLGLMLGGLVWSDQLGGQILGWIGVVLFLAALGVVELVMALWYRIQRTRLRS